MDVQAHVPRFRETQINHRLILNGGVAPIR